MPVPRPGAAWLLLLPLAAAAFLWWPLTGAYFHTDDFLHLYAIADGRPLEFLVTPHGGHMLVVRNALFWLTRAAAGAEPRGWYLIAIALHLANLALLFALLRRAAGSAALAVFGTLLWGTAPFARATLGWLSVNGQAVQAGLMLVALVDMVGVARAGAPVSAARATGWTALLLAGAACFGTGIGVAGAALLAIPLLLPAPTQRAARHAALALPVLVALAYVLTHVAYAAWTGAPHASAATQVSLAAVPTMAGFYLDLVHAGIAAATAGVLAPGLANATPALLVAWLLFAAAALAGGTPLARRLAGASLLLAAGAYGIIALGRGPRLAAFGVAAGDAAEWERYHYVPSLFLVVVLCLGLRVVAARLRLPRVLGALALALWLAAAALSMARHPLALDPYTDEREEVARLQALLRAQAAATPGAGPVYVFNRRTYPLGYVVPATEFPGWAGLWIAVAPVDAIDGRPVRFVEDDTEVVAAARRRPGTRSAALLLTRAEYRAATGLPPLLRPPSPDSAP